uniref:F-box/WD repeat-containing protein 2 n=1 Tax=Nannospalax galili TaxID=1026970 RepID=A0A8C6RD73_NANGA
MEQLEDHEAFETSSLIGHSARVYVLYYKDELLCIASDDLSAKLWDVSIGQCVYGIQTHTCATVKFDEQQLVTGSFDNTVACWEWSSGAAFSMDYNDELEILVSGSAYFTVKVWALSAGTCLNILTGHTEWVTNIVLQKRKVKSLLHSPGDYILLSAGKYELRIWPIGREINCKCLKTLSVSEDKVSVCSQDFILVASMLSIVWHLVFMIFSVINTPEIIGSLISCWPLPEHRKSKRGKASWLNGLDGHNDTDLDFATSMPDYSIHLVLWKEYC